MVRAKQQREQQRRRSLAVFLSAVFVVGLVLVSVLPEHLGHALSGFAGDFRSYVAVGIHGQRDLTVAEDFHHDPGRHALGKQETRRRMAKVMKPYGGQSGAGEQLLELPVVVAGFDRRAELRGEDTRAAPP
jgi:hypothetical protein